MVEERTLDYRTRHDARSRNYAVAEAITPVPLRSQFWTPGRHIFDQGREGACVGHGIAGDLACSPVRVKKLDNTFAFELYEDAKRRDPWEGENYEGTSVLAGMQAAVARGFYTGYRWAFSLEDVKQALIQVGPVVLGIPWYESMYEAPGGVVEVSGAQVGGHCIVLTGYAVRRGRLGEGFRWRNSWGRDYGVNGSAFIRVADLHRLLIEEKGEAAIPVGRRLP